MMFVLQVLTYLSLKEEDEDEDDISWLLIQKVMSSVAQTAIIPMQDILGLGSSARMNTPATQVKSLCKAYLKVVLAILFCFPQ